MKNKKYWFWRSVLISCIVFGCMVLCIVGTAAAYEGIAKTGFAQYKQAVCYEDGKFIIFGKNTSGLE